MFSLYSSEVLFHGLKSYVKSINAFLCHFLCDTQMSGHRAMIITGPNMGGKSSYIKQVILATSNLVVPSSPLQV